MLRERDRRSCPCGTQLALERILVLEPFKRCRRGMLRNRREQENGTRARCRRTSVAASTKNEPAVSAKCLEHVLRKIHGCLTTRVLDEGPTAAVGRTTSNRE